MQPIGSKFVVEAVNKQNLKRYMSAAANGRKGLEQHILRGIGTCLVARRDTFALHVITKEDYAEMESLSRQSVEAADSH